MLTLGQAAKHTGLSKSTISRAIASGRLSVFSKGTGSYSIDPAELFRVFPSNSSDNPPLERSATPIETPAQHHDTAALVAEIAGLKAVILKLEDQIADLKQQRDGWQDQAQSSQRLLVDMRPKGGLFGFLRRGS